MSSRTGGSHPQPLHKQHVHRRNHEEGQPRRHQQSEDHKTLRPRAYGCRRIGTSCCIWAEEPIGLVATLVLEGDLHFSTVGANKDALALGIAHRDGERAVLDVVRPRSLAVLSS